MSEALIQCTNKRCEALIYKGDQVYRTAGRLYCCMSCAMTGLGIKPLKLQIK